MFIACRSLPYSAFNRRLPCRRADGALFYHPADIKARKLFTDKAVDVETVFPDYAITRCPDYEIEVLLPKLLLQFRYIFIN
jgi:hypothetical protein